MARGVWQRIPGGSKRPVRASVPRASDWPKPAKAIQRPPPGYGDAFRTLEELVADLRAKEKPHGRA